MIGWHGGQYDEARKKYLYAADLYHKTGDTEGEAFVYSRLGELELSLDNYKEAEKALRQSTALVENYIDGQNTYGEALIKLSKVQTASGEDEKALQTIKKAQEVTAATDNKNLLGDAYEQEAYICLLNNKEQQALEKYRLAADLFNQDGTTLKEAATLRAMARLEMKFKIMTWRMICWNAAAICIVKTAICSARPAHCRQSAVCAILSAIFRTRAKH